MTATVVTLPPAEQALVWAGFPVLGAGLGWGIKAIAGWAITLPWVPFDKPLEFIASLPEPHVTIGALAVGGVAGLVLAFLAIADHVVITVDDDRASLVYGDSRQEVRRADVGAAYLDGKAVVLLGHATEEIARSRGSLPSAARIRDAFVRHGYPWHADGDPHREEFRRWVEDHPELSPTANALLRARARALEKDRGDDAAELRTELARLGVVVRDRDKRQHWRRVPGDD
ncbi:hypothetical protein [Spongiactinospora sp. 9N601]|uniref:YqeB family protein n=1 Tax=Spongiactinospora sp. 9N601 TaxID=3375149 RepID=UPI0037BBF238